MLFQKDDYVVEYEDYYKRLRFKRFITVLILLSLIVGSSIGCALYVKNVCSDTYERLSDFETYGITAVKGYVPNTKLQSCFENIDLLAYDTEGYLVFDVKYKTQFLVTYIEFVPYLDDNLATITDREKYLEIIQPYLDKGITFR